MARELVKLTNYETGEVRTVALTQGHLLAVTAKAGAHRGAFANALMMAYLAADDDAWDLTGQDLVDGAARFFTQWDYEEGAGEPDAPLAPKSE